MASWCLARRSAAPLRAVRSVRTCRQSRRTRRRAYRAASAWPVGPARRRSPHPSHRPGTGGSAPRSGCCAALWDPPERAIRPAPPALGEGGARRGTRRHAAQTELHGLIPLRFRHLTRVDALPRIVGNEVPPDRGEAAQTANLLEEGFNARLIARRREAGDDAVLEWRQLLAALAEC